MNIVKNRFRNKMEDNFLIDYLLTYVERRITEIFYMNFIIGEFYDDSK